MKLGLRTPVLHLVTNSTLKREFEVQVGIYWHGFEGLKLKRT
jgi:hypothetical protein